MKDKTIIDNSIFCDLQEFLNQFYPNSEASLLSGSLATNTQHEYSDIDLIIFSKNHDRFFLESIAFRDHKIQVIMFPSNKVRQLLLRDLKRSEGIYIDMISKGIPIKQNGVYLNELVDYCKRLKELGPPSPRTKRTDGKVIKLSNIYFSLKGTKDYQELVFIAADALNVLTDLILYSSKKWNSAVSGKHRKRSLSNIDNRLVEDFVLGMEDLHLTKKPTKLLDLIERKLEYFGGVKSYYSTDIGLTQVWCNNLIIAIPINTYSFGRLNKLIGTILSSDEKLLNKFYFKRSNLLLENKNQIDSLLIIINENSTSINQKIIPQLFKTINNNEVFRKINLIYPVNQDAKIFMGCEETTYSEYFSIFNGLSKVILSKDLLTESISVKVKFAKDLLNLIIEFYFENNKNKIAIYIEYLLDFAILPVLEKKYAFGHKQIIAAKENIYMELEMKHNSMKQEVKAKHLNTFDRLEKSTIFNTLFTINNLLKKEELNPSDCHSFPKELSKEERVIWFLSKNLIFEICSIFLLKDEDKLLLLYTLQKENEM